MGIASLILGIVSIIFGWIPFVSFLGLILSVVGLILGIVDTVKKSKAGQGKGVSIAGLIICAIAVVITVYMSFVSGVGLALFATNHTSLY